MDVLTRNNVQERGIADGQPMLFAHGYGCDQNMWRLVSPAFEDEYRVIVFDHVGAGQSDTSAFDPAKYDGLQGYANDIIEICEALDLRDVVFVGHSVAAMMGVLAANAAPERFAKLVLVGPSPRYIDTDGYRGGFSEQEIADLLRSLESNFLGWSAQIAPAIMGRPDRPELADELADSFCRMDPDIAAHFARVTFLSDNRHDLAQVSVPTLVLQCSSDIIAPDEVGRFVHETVPDSTLIKLQATGHCPNLSAPDETIAAIRSFL